jgi:predicted PurR-regulated permease PerM
MTAATAALKTKDKSGARGRRSRTIRFELSGGSLLSVLVAIAAVWLFAQVWEVVLIVIGALILVGTLNPFAARLQRRGFNRTLAVTTVFLVVLAVLGLLLLLVVPSFVHQVSALWTGAPALQAQVADQLARQPLTRGLADPVRHLQPGQLLAKHGDEVFRAGTT